MSLSITPRPGIECVYAKGILSRLSNAPDSWFGLTYNMNLYRGCQHQCIYCDSRSECYQIRDFRVIQVKMNALELLEKALAGKRKKGTIGTGSMNDPYMPLEKEVNLTGQALRLIERFHFPVHILTKSDLVLRDLEILASIATEFAAVSFSLSTIDDNLAKILEPAAPSPTQRLEAISILRDKGIRSGVLLMPVLPFLTDSWETIRELVLRAKDAGAEYILPSLGMTMRDRQREYFFDALDVNFPGVSSKYRRIYGNSYDCGIPDEKTMRKRLREFCQEHKMPLKIPVYSPAVPVQPSLF